MARVPARALRHRLGEVHARIEIEREDEIGIRLDVGRVSRDRRAEGIDRLLQPAAPEQRETEIVMRLGDLRMTAHGFREGEHGGGIITARGMREPDAEQRLGKHRIERQRVAETLQRLVGPFARQQGVAEIGVVGCMRRLVADAVAVRRHALEQAPEAYIDLTEIRQRDDIGRPQRDRVREGLGGIVEAAGAGMHGAEAVPGKRVVRFSGDAGAHEVQRLVREAEAVGDVAEPPQRLRMARLRRQHGLVGAAGIGEAARVIKRAGAIEVAGGLGAHKNRRMIPPPWLSEAYRRPPHRTVTHCGRIMLSGGAIASTPARAPQVSQGWNSGTWITSSL
jgi:hypothetical protein